MRQVNYPVKISAFFGEAQRGGMPVGLVPTAYEDWRIRYHRHMESAGTR